jgi:hypothetical protein
MHYDLEMLLRGAWKAPSAQELQKEISDFSETEKITIRKIADHIIISGMHDLLFALQGEADSEGSIRLLVDNLEVAKSSDGMHGEIFGDEGWIAKFSEYKNENGG